MKYFIMVKFSELLKLQIFGYLFGYGQ